MGRVLLKLEPDGVARLERALGLEVDDGNDQDKLAVGSSHVDMLGRAHELGHLDGALERTLLALVGKQNLLGTHAGRNLLHVAAVPVEGKLSAGLGGERHVHILGLDGKAVARAHQLGIEEVHLRHADEAGDEDVRGMVEDLLRGGDLLDDAVPHDHDAVAEGHSLGLVVSNINERALDLVAQTVNIGKLFLPSYYWGCYFKMLKIRSVESEGYDSQSDLLPMIDRLQGNAVLISDPSNPLGDKHDDEEQLNIIRALNDAGVVIFYDCPYRRLFMDASDDYYTRLMNLDNVIITESFSKSVGLSGQRLGFIHTCNKELHDELEVRVMYNTNGINGFAQELVLRLLTTPEGKKAVTAFKERTTRDIALNIEYLRARGLLAEEFYHGTTPQGIFVIVNRSEEELLEHYIGAVSLSFFTKTRQEYAKNYSRICVSVPHDKLVKYFETI